MIVVWIQAHRQVETLALGGRTGVRYDRIIVKDVADEGPNESLEDAAPQPLPEQREFIEKPVTSHAILAAGPGTGKTWVLERRSDFS